MSPLQIANGSMRRIAPLLGPRTCRSRRQCARYRDGLVYKACSVVARGTRAVVRLGDLEGLPCSNALAKLSVLTFARNRGKPGHT